MKTINQTTIKRAAMMLAVLLFSTLTAGAQITYYATDGTEGNYYYDEDNNEVYENYKNLIDGDKATKWCVTSLGNPTFIEFYSSEPITPKGYVLTTGNDTGRNPGRNPKSWTIKARAKESDDWTILTTVTDYTKMPAANTTECPFPLTNTNSYQYFRFEISEIQEGEIFQLAEFRFLSSYAPTDLATATVGGLKYLYDYGETVDFSSLFLIDFNGDTIDASNYTYVIKKNDIAVNVIEKGLYKLVITPTPGSDYTGTLVYSFIVFPWKNEGGWCGNPDANDGTNVYYEITESEGTKTLSIHAMPELPATSDFSMENNHWFPKYFNSVEIDDGITSIGSGAFKEFSKLTTITIPNSVTNIGEEAFTNCSGLTNLIIPNSVNSIGSQAFSGCAGLTTVVIGSGVTYIDNFAFWLCNNVTDVYCYADPKKLKWLRAEADFAPGKTTICHVFDEDEYKKRWATGDKYNDVNVIFKGDFGYLYENANNSVMIDNLLNMVQNVKLAGRTLYCDGNWQTLCLPFSLANFGGTSLEGFTVMELDTDGEIYEYATGIEGTTLYLNFKPTTSIEAGKPYIVKKLEATPDESSTPTYSATRGTAGYASWPDFNYYNLIDGTTSNRWRTSFSNGSTVYCEFEAKDKPVIATGYTLISGNISTAFDPKVWTLQAKLSKDDPWTVIDSRDAILNGGDAVNSNRTKPKDYTIQKPGAYKFFRFEVTANGGGAQMCLTNLTMHGFYIGEPVNIVNPTFEGALISNSEPVPVTSGDSLVTFCGSYSAKAFDSGDKGIFLLGSENKLHNPDSSETSLGVCRACLSVKSPVNLKLLTDVVLGRKAATPDANLNNDTQVDITDITTLIDNILNNRPLMPTITTVVSNVDLGLGH